MEPVAYFVSLGTAVAAYLYFLVTKESFDYKPLRQVRQWHTHYDESAVDDKIDGHYWRTHGPCATPAWGHPPV